MRITAAVQASTELVRNRPELLRELLRGRLSALASDLGHTLVAVSPEPVAHTDDDLPPHMVVVTLQGRTAPPS